MKALTPFRRLFPWLVRKPRIFALVGKSGTGKSFKARQVARRFRIDLIVDDGLLIRGQKIIAGDRQKGERAPQRHQDGRLREPRPDRGGAPRAVRAGLQPRAHHRHLAQDDPAHRLDPRPAAHPPGDQHHRGGHDGGDQPGAENPRRTGQAHHSRARRGDQAQLPAHLLRIGEDPSQGRARGCGTGKRRSWKRQ